MKIFMYSFQYAKKHMHIWIGIWFLGVVFALLTCFLPQLMQVVIDRIINPALGADPVYTEYNIFTPIMDLFGVDDYFNMFICVIGLFTALNLVRYLVHYVRWCGAFKYGSKLELELNNVVFKRLLTQGQSVIELYVSGDYMNFCAKGGIHIRQMWAVYINTIISECVTIIFAIFFLFLISPYLVILPIIVGIISVFVMRAYTNGLQDKFEIVRQSSVKLNTMIQENINNVRALRAYAAEDLAITRFDEKNNIYKDNYIKHSKINAFFYVWFNFLSQAINVCSIIIGVVLAVNGTISIGEFSTFLTYIALINAPLINICTQFNSLQNAIVCAGRMFKFYHIDREIVDTVVPETLGELESISMENVSVKLSDIEDLHDISFNIKAGAKIGIMGRSGSGKSILLRALPRILETTSGHTCINGIDIKDYKVKDVRELFSYCHQEVFLFADTVEGNIALYDKEAHPSKIVDAAITAEICEFISRLPQGFYTVIGEKGMGLSGGQRQRISIARALLKDAPVLIFDDCTSALDRITEERVVSNIFEKCKDKTIFIASHRANAVEKCDEILYLECGSIVERGTHAELMAQKGKYYEVYIAQQTALKEEI